MKLSEGVPFKVLCAYGGLSDYTAAGFARFFVSSWLVPAKVPFAFFDSRHFGVGLLFLSALISLPLWWKGARRTVRVLIVTFAVGSAAMRDFWLPRYSFMLLLLVFVSNGLALAVLAASRKTWTQCVYIALVMLVSAHALSPEWEVQRYLRSEWVPRINVARSPLFVAEQEGVVVYPDVHAKLVIVHSPKDGFVLPLYGRKLSNDIVGTVFPDGVGEDCRGLARFVSGDASVLFVDDYDYTKTCTRECALPGAKRCLAFRVLPSATHGRPVD